VRARFVNTFLTGRFTIARQNGTLPANSYANRSVRASFEKNRCIPTPDKRFGPRLLRLS
jgi:hypothetical protein